MDFLAQSVPIQKSHLTLACVFDVCFLYDVECFCDLLSYIHDATLQLRAPTQFFLLSSNYIFLNLEEAVWWQGFPQTYNACFERSSVQPSNLASGRLSNSCNGIKIVRPSIYSQSKDRCPPACAAKMEAQLRSTFRSVLGSFSKPGQLKQCALA